MKQQKLIKAILLLALALLMVSALVACNKENSDSFELSEGAQQVVELAKADIDAAFNYFLNAAEAITNRAENGRAAIYITYENMVDGEDQSGAMAHISLDLSEFDSYYLCVFQNEADAQKYYDEEFGDHPDEREDQVVVMNNKVISDFTAYQKSLSYKRPSSITKFTDAQIKFMEGKLHRGVGTQELYASMFGSFEVGEDSNVFWDMEPLKGNYRSEEGISHQDKDNLTNIKKFLSVNYSEDSYINYDEATNIVTYKLTTKPGWFVSEITDYDDRPTGKYRASYIYADVPSQLTIPAKVSGYDIDEAYVDISEEDATIDSVIIEKAMSEVELDGNIRQITIPVSNQAFVSIRHNRALLTINFNGSMEQWEALQLHALRYTDADDWTRAYYVYSSDYVNITFTVACTNGDIVYPKA